MMGLILEKRPHKALNIGVYFFFQAEDGIRDVAVTGVQTCALPIFVGVMPPGVTLFASQGSLTEKVAQLWWPYGWRDEDWAPRGRWMSAIGRLKPGVRIGRASCRERV